MNRFTAGQRFSHRTAPLTAVLLVQLGTPDEPEPGPVRRYLKQFLSDPRVVEIPRLAWWPILNGIILQHPAAQVVGQVPGGLDDRRLAAAGPHAAPGGAAARLARRARPRRGGRARDALRQPVDRRRPARTARAQPDAAAGRAALSAVRRVDHGLCLRRARARARPAGATCRSCGWCAASTTSRATSPRSRRRCAATGSAKDAADRLVMSFHGLPQRSLDAGRSLSLRVPGDRDGCWPTSSACAATTGSPPSSRASAAPAGSSPTRCRPCSRLARSGVATGRRRLPRLRRRLPGDARGDRHRGRAARSSRPAARAFNYIACLNESPHWIAALADLAERHLSGWPVARPGRRVAAAAGSRTRAARVAARRRAAPPPEPRAAVTAAAASAAGLDPSDADQLGPAR